MNTMGLLAVTEAYDIIMRHAPAPVAESIELDKAANRILLEKVLADRDYPPMDRSTMDGVAISLSSWNAGVRQWRREGTVPAGTPAPALGDPVRGCLTVMTGGELPAGCDGIIPFEQVDLTDEMATAHGDAAFHPRQFIHEKASDRRTGEVLLDPGQRLDAPRIAILAAVGHTPVKVARPPRVAVISTGSEIVPVAQRTLSPVQSRASNAAGLITGLRHLGIVSISSAHSADNLATTVGRIEEQLASCDVLLITGGVSKGHYDFVPSALKQAGIREIFHGVAQKPGKPLWFGQGNNVTALGLPGNPVSTLTVFRRYVTPLIGAMTGAAAAAPYPVTITRPIKPHPLLTLFPPVRLVDHQTVEPVAYHGSGDFAALACSHGFVEIPPGDTEHPNVMFWAW